MKTKLGLDKKENSQSLQNRPSETRSFRNRPNLRVEVNPDDISPADSDEHYVGNFPSDKR